MRSWMIFFKFYSRSILLYVKNDRVKWIVLNANLPCDALTETKHAGRTFF